MVAIAWTGSSVVIAALPVDNSGDLLYWWQPAGATQWNKEIVATALQGQEPAIAWTGSSVVITAVDGMCNLLYWWQQAGTTQWNKETVAQNWTGTTSVFPAIAWTGSTVVIAASDKDGSIWYWWQPAGATQWNKELVVKGGVGSTQASWVACERFGNPALAWTGSSVVIAAPDNAANLLYWWQQAGTTPWNEEMVAENLAGSAIKGPRKPAIAWTGSSVVIAANDSLGNLWYWWQPAGAPQWGGAQCVSVYSPSWESAPWSGGPPVGAPAIAWTGSSVVIAAVDVSGNLFYWWQPAGGSQWTKETVANNILQDFTPAIAWTGSSVVIAAVDTSDNLLYWWQPSGSTQWNKETVANLG